MCGRAEHVIGHMLGGRRRVMDHAYRDLAALMEERREVISGKIERPRIDRQQPVHETAITSWYSSAVSYCLSAPPQAGAGCTGSYWSGSARPTAAPIPAPWPGITVTLSPQLLPACPRNELI
jgi:hypothetical protein